ncbi:NTE family protein [Pedococcus dokdonensis]|uniref:NTE family protein n=1 Tax=Pedococcus dokdonensis TaxID=443156 RepID=A0A1H0TX54_9MICO|nr:NTE family protein [Pedococcus dokdonensis]
MGALGRALVLAGGGAAGHAWELGLIAGLAEGGVDLVAADLVIGTSAGSTVAAQITCAGEVFDANALDPATRLPAARGGHAQGLALAPYLAAFWN